MASPLLTSVDSGLLEDIVVASLDILVEVQRDIEHDRLVLFLQQLRPSIEECFQQLDFLAIDDLMEQVPLLLCVDILAIVDLKDTEYKLSRGVAFLFASINDGRVFL
jgi:hypothetical protein